MQIIISYFPIVFHAQSGGSITGKTRRTSPSPAAVTITTSTDTTKTSGDDNSTSHKRSTSSTVKTREATQTFGRRRVEDQSLVRTEEPTVQLPDGANLPAGAHCLGAYSSVQRLQK